MVDIVIARLLGDNVVCKGDVLVVVLTECYNCAVNQCCFNVEDTEGFRIKYPVETFVNNAGISRESSSDTTSSSTYWFVRSG